jgi:hypothetical protein
VGFWDALDIATPILVVACLFGFAASGRLARVWSRASLTQRVLTLLVGLVLGCIVVSATISTDAWSSIHDFSVLGSLLIPGVVVALKSRPAWFIAGVLFPPIWIVPALRLAPPSSMWARGVYDDALLRAAGDRFGPKHQRDWSRVLAPLASLGLVAFVVVGLLVPVLDAI